MDSGWNTGRSETASARVEERCRGAAPRERHALAARAFAVSPQKATGTTTPPRRPEGVLWGQFSKAGLMSRLGTDSRVPSWGNTGANSTKSPPGTPHTDTLTGGGPSAWSRGFAVASHAHGHLRHRGSRHGALPRPERRGTRQRPPRGSRLGEERSPSQAKQTRRARAPPATSAPGRSRGLNQQERPTAPGWKWGHGEVSA